MKYHVTIERAGKIVHQEVNITTLTKALAVIKDVARHTKFDNALIRSGE